MRARALAVLALVACGGGEPADDGPDAGLTGDDLAALVTARCTAGACHDADEPAAGLDLASPDLERRLLGAPGSEACAGLPLIAPGNPAGSLLYRKLGPSPPCGARMPLAGEPLADDVLAGIAAYIESSGTGLVGCADGQREGFARIGDYPDIAACAGAWSVPGLAEVTPTCDRDSGDDARNASGLGCSAADLCEDGWHICTDGADVAAAAGELGCSELQPTEGGFFATAQSGPGGAACGEGDNDLFGCGDLGDVPAADSCGPLDRFSNDLCGALGALWFCGSDGYRERANVVKTETVAGGVLCCRD